MGFKLLLTENQSALGEAIYRGLEDYPYTVLCPSSSDIDWQDLQASQQYFSEQHPSLLVNTLAQAGTEAPQASLTLAEASAQQGIPCLHLSSYRVFGTASCEGGYGEADIPEPNDPLGRDLLAAEAAFGKLNNAIVLRLPWVMQSAGDNVFTRVASWLTSGDTLQVSDLSRGCPTTVDDVRRVVVAMGLQILCGAENWGVFHLHTSDSCSEAEFADHIARLLEKAGQAPGAIDVLRDEEHRLMSGCGLLKGSRCMNNFGIQPRSWRHGTKALVEEWLEGDGKRGKTVKGDG